MVIKNIYYSSDFLKEFRLLPMEIKKKSVRQESIFRTNAFHPSLRLHKLHGRLSGRWSISVDKAYRIIFGIGQSGDIVFLSIGRHAIYEK